MTVPAFKRGRRQAIRRNGNLFPSQISANSGMSLLQTGLELRPTGFLGLSDGSPACRAHIAFLRRFAGRPRGSVAEDARQFLFQRGDFVLEAGSLP